MDTCGLTGGWILVLAGGEPESGEINGDNMARLVASFTAKIWRENTSENLLTGLDLHGGTKDADTSMGSRLTIVSPDGETNLSGEITRILLFYKTLIGA
jgi:hypothetical protein